MQMWWQWLAKKAHIQSRVDYAEKMSWFRMGVAKASGAPAVLTAFDYPQDEQATGAYECLLDEHPQIGSYELPEKQTGPIKPVNPELQRWGVDTVSLPAYPGQWMRLRKQNGKLPKAGK